jgi:hypothetical protein
MRKYAFPILVLTVCLLLAAGCARQQSRMARLLPEVDTITKARLHFGPPKSTVEEPDGAIRHEWLLDNAYTKSGQWVIEKSPWVTHDSDGYRVEHYRKVWREGGRRVDYCRLSIICDKEGRVLRSDWQGNSCETLIMHDPLRR